MGKVKGTTSSGFNFSLDTDDMNDMRVIEALAEIEKGNVLYVVDLIKLMLGTKQKEALYKHIANKDGKVSPELCMVEIKEIFEKAGEEVKN